MMWNILTLLVLAAANVVNGLVSCDFENTVGDPWCSFYQSSDDNLDWKLDTARTQTSFTRPILDHTLSSVSGHYVFIESSFPTQGTGRIARLLSPTMITGTSSDFCLQFSYHMYGPPDQTLHVFARAHGQAVGQNSDWHKTGDLGDVWREQNVTFSVSQGFQIIFEATQGTNHSGDVSLDDISITSGACQQATPNTTISPTRPSATPITEFECNLDYNNLCGFQAATRNPTDWKWRGNTNPSPLGPLGDHTSGSSTGFFLFVSKDPPNQQQEQRIRIISPLIGINTASKCLMFHHFMNGNKVGTLNGYVMQDNVTLPLEPVWSKNVSTSDLWQPAFMDIAPQGTNYQVVFEVIRGTDFNGCIAIDDLKLNDDICPTVNATTDFEKNGIGDFIQDQTDDMDWRMHSGRTYSYYTGPNKDHTFGNTSGHFIYLEASYPARPGHVARLLSPLLLATSADYPRCLTFWYHMFGDDVEALNIYIINGTQSDQRNVLWSRAGNRGNRWRAAEVHLESSINFQVVFEAENGNGYRGDIALDDIKIEADVCPGEHHFHNYSSITCDFEESELCYYEQEQFHDDVDWTWINSDSAAYYVATGPTYDHTRKDDLGFYLFVTYANVRTYWWYRIGNQKAHIRSPYAAPQKRTSCLEFWYHMYGRDTESLRVFVQNEGEDIPSEPAFEISGDQGNFWHRASFDIDVLNIRYRIVFEATTGRTYQDDIAIDDVKFYNNSYCPPFVTQPPPPVTLPPSRSNADCNFEDIYMCNYTQRIEDNMDWSRRNGNRYTRYWYYRTRPRFTGPKFDHTKKNNNGFYMNFDCGWWYYGIDYRAQLATPYISPHTNKKCMQFYYYMYGNGVDFLNLYLLPFGYTLTNDPQKSFYGNQGDQWNYGTFELPSCRDPYIVIFEATKGFYYWCDIAIDDITFLDGPCPEDKATQLPPTAGNCDFESDEDPLCGYEQDTNYGISKYGYHYVKDDFDWTLNSGNTSSANTGPTGDHTLNSAKGHYMYIESSLPRRPWNNARLISPLIEGSEEKMCVQFYCHMKGSGIGYLYLFWQTGVTVEQKIISIIGEQGDDWVVKTAELEPFPGQFVLIFEAYVGRVTYGDIAIDDITILRQPCQGHVKESECSFDLAGDWCGYTQSVEDDLNWKWHDANQANPLLNTTGDKSFVYVAGGSSDKGKIARISSRAIDGRSSQHCLEFDYYFSQNSTSSKLTIAIRRNNGNQLNIMTLVVDDEKDNWKHQINTLSKGDVGEKFQVIFIGVLGENQGIIGLDNPSVSLGSCEEQSGQSSSSRSTGSASASVATFFGILSAFLIIALVAAATYYLYRKRRDTLASYTVRYENKDSDNNEMKSMPKQLTIENPLYSDPPIISTAVSFDNSDMNGSK
ncbi:MAM and LDL-receptor class A domain-containing protein 2-like [Amphiura filiformis]|uniref:MAM and LDL-receptor class A domain-containing protein 2-like n=1 Tax=Amphiura filiformis TaxID=82378 RepID=UPI003B20D851